MKIPNEVADERARFKSCATSGQFFFKYFEKLYNFWANKLFGNGLCEGEKLIRLRIIFFRLRIFEFCAQEPLLNSSSYRNFIITVRLSAGLNFMKQKEKFIPKTCIFRFFCSFVFRMKIRNMKVKFYILGILAALCLVGTVIYVRALHEEHDQKVAEWKESAKTAFEVALWMEVDKRAEIPFYSYFGEEKGTRILKPEIPDSIYMTTALGRRGYRLERYRHENNLM